jgi:hypothetical protein
MVDAGYYDSMHVPRREWLPWSAVAPPVPPAAAIAGNAPSCEAQGEARDRALLEARMSMLDSHAAALEAQQSNLDSRTAECVSLQTHINGRLRAATPPRRRTPGQAHPQPQPRPLTPTQTHNSHPSPKPSPPHPRSGCATASPSSRQSFVSAALATKRCVGRPPEERSSPRSCSRRVTS